MSKRCFKCGEIKPLSEFYRHPQMRDGRVNKCKPCNKRDIAIHRRENPHVQERERLRYESESNEARERRNEISRQWRKDHPEAYKAHNAVNNAIRDGKIVRQSCRVCGDPKSHAHHADYSKPLEVDWLCARHHQREHNPIE